jgi:hypothetical protein
LARARSASKIGFSGLNSSVFSVSGLAVIETLPSGGELEDELEGELELELEDGLDFARAFTISLTGGFAAGFRFSFFMIPSKSASKPS